MTVLALERLGVKEGGRAGSSRVTVLRSLGGHGEDFARGGER